MLFYQKFAAAYFVNRQNYYTFVEPKTAVCNRVEGEMGEWLKPPVC